MKDIRTVCSHELHCNVKINPEIRSLLFLSSNWLVHPITFRIKTVVVEGNVSKLVDNDWTKGCHCWNTFEQQVRLMFYHWSRQNCGLTTYSIYGQGCLQYIFYYFLYKSLINLMSSADTCGVSTTREGTVHQGCGSCAHYQHVFHLYMHSSHW